ncbi:MAG: elongation factor P hydroxylase [Pseudomonas sp.]
MKHDCADLISLFAECFAADYQTCLVGGGLEPEYVPAAAPQAQHQIIFTRDYFRSALHEVAHWCVAGAQRRQLRDFGYWYAPDGRDADQQRAFEQVEVKPQALEWLFCQATGHPFSVSLDNLSGEATDSQPFEQAVREQVLSYLDGALPQRPRDFIDALLGYYRPGAGLTADQFVLP